MLQRIRFFFLRLLIGKTPVVANCEFSTPVNFDTTRGILYWNNNAKSISVNGKKDEYARGNA